MTRFETALGNWRLCAVFEGCLPIIAETQYPQCTEGERSGVPRDGMEPKDYRRFLRALADANDPYHEAALLRARWQDPAEFDLDVVNAELQACYPARTTAERADPDAQWAPFSAESTAHQHRAGLEPRDDLEPT